MAANWSLGVILVGLFVLYSDGVHADMEKRLGSPFVQSAINEAIEMVNRAYKQTRVYQKERLKKRSLTSSDLLRFFKHPVSETKLAVKSAEYMETALNLIQNHVHRIHKRALNASDLLSPSDLDTIAHVTGCLAITRPPVCKDDCWSNRYRTFTSICNNRMKPRLGSSNTALARWLPARYEDGISIPLGWTPNKLPLAREVSNKILKVSNKDVISDKYFSHMFMQWGQWIDHDMSLSPVSGSLETFNDGINCERTCVQRNPCFPIKIPPGDPRITQNETCMPFFRSAPACGTGESASLFGDVNPRQQINSLTSFIDVNEVYGSTDCLANKLRNLTNELGLLAVNQEYSDNGREYLPFITISRNLCGVLREACAAHPKATPCFIGGDVRVNEQLGLLSIHTIFLREHNRIARELKRLNPHWSGDTIYHETRKILGAFQQIINTRDYIPKVIGDEASQEYLPSYNGYDASVNPSIASVFSTAAFRFGHLSIQPTLFRLDENFKEHPQFKNLPLHLTFFSPWRMIREGGVDPLIRGLFGHPAKLHTQDKLMVDELRDNLFKLTAHVSLDLGSLNIQRSRDHGLQGYTAWRRFCGLSEPKTLLELTKVIKNMDLARKLIELYKEPANIDVWVGAISEPFLEGAKVGPLLACIIGKQFRNLRDGDRFWWENDGVFTSTQRMALYEITMSRIICDNTGIKMISPDAFRFQEYPLGYVNCSSIPQVDLSAWREDRQVTPCGSVPFVAHGYFSICKSSVRYMCESGYTLVGGDTITCVSNGEWQPAPPGCIATVEPLWTEEEDVEVNVGPQGMKGEKGDIGPRGPKGDNMEAQIQMSAFSAKLSGKNLKSGKPIPCETEVYNGQGHFNCPAGIFTCQIPGVYQFSYNCEVTSEVSVFLKKDGSTLITSNVFARAAKAILSGGTILQLAAGDRIWLENYPTKQGAIDSCYFQGHLLFGVQ
ncbi:eosinophil peroxidase-like isoform X2 [Narcine bancroftii]